MDGPNPQYDGLTAFAPITNAATATKKGLLSAADKAKLDTLATTVSRLSYNAAADQLNGAAVAAATWSAIGPTQTFSVGDVAHWLAVEVQLGLIATAAGACGMAARLSFDSGALAIKVSGGVIAGAGDYGALSGNVLFLPPGTLAAGSHTVQPQMYSILACTGYLRPASQPNTEFLALTIVEFA